MKLIGQYIKKYQKLFMFGLGFKFISSVLELLIPYVMEHIIDTVALSGNLMRVLLWGAGMIALALATWAINLKANNTAIRMSSRAAYDMRQQLFQSTIGLSGDQFDDFSLPSLTSRMTSDSYNVQNFLRAMQTMGVRAPIMLIGGIIITMTMDMGLSLILCVLAPIMIVIIVMISRMGVPLYDQVQERLDRIVCIMRENITGIRVVKSLSKENYERQRYNDANEEMTRSDRKASIIMSLPGPLMTLALNIGLTLVVIIGARRVNAGLTEPGVILAFLTYFNMIMMGVMGLNRIFMMLSKASASADRISAVIEMPDQLVPVPVDETPAAPSDDYIIFDDVTFGYGDDDDDDDDERFDGEERQDGLSNISFSIRKGGSLGIIGATGSGKTTIINLLMRFYDTDSGHVFVDGRDVRTYAPDDLRSRFGVVFQNDVVFAMSLADNISFGRNVGLDEVTAAAREAQAAEFIEEYEDGYEHLSEIRGANFSGGQKQRILISRALASNPDILILDDASSALDYRTDAELRKAIRENHSDATSIIIAQRISSIMSLDRILMLDDGKIIGYGTHDELMKTCQPYIEIFHTQMGGEQ